MNLTLVGLLLFMAAEMFYDYSAVPKSTSHTVIYFSAIYLSYVTMIADSIWKEKSKIIKCALGAFLLLFITLTTIELCSINLPYEDYMINANRGRGRLWAFRGIAIILLTITIRSCQKRLWRRYLK